MLCRVNLPYLDHLVIMEADYRRYIQGFNVIPADSRRKNIYEMERFPRKSNVKLLALSTIATTEEDGIH